jgi:hypothetical protein
MCLFNSLQIDHTSVKIGQLYDVKTSAQNLEFLSLLLKPGTVRTSHHAISGTQGMTDISDASTQIDNEKVFSVTDNIWTRDVFPGEKLMTAEAVKHCYEFLPELMDEMSDDESGSSTPTNEFRTDRVNIVEDDFATHDFIYFEHLYWDFEVMHSDVIVV